MAIEQQRHPEARPGQRKRIGERPMPGPVIAHDAGIDLRCRQPSPINIGAAWNAARDEAEPATDAGRADGAGGRRRSFDHGGIKLALVTVEIDPGARMPGHECGSAGIDRIRDQRVRQPVLQCFEPAARHHGGSDQRRRIDSPGMGNGEDDRGRGRGWAEPIEGWSVVIVHTP